MLVVEQVLGSRMDATLSERLHHLQHHGRVDVLTLPASELARRRFRAKSEGGQDVAVALPRDQKLYDGAVLQLSDAAALVVRVAEQQWLRLEPASDAVALELGYHAGNLHWRVRFDGAALLVALEAPAQVYIDRIATLIDDGRVRAAVVTPGVAT